MKAVELLLASDLPAASQLLRVSTVTFADPQDPVKSAAMIFNPRTGASTVKLNRAFVSQYSDTPLKLGALIMHELMHKMLHHMVIYPADGISNLAQDMLINALICRLASNFQQLFTDTYTKNEFPWMMLRPGANLRRIEHKDIQAEVGGLYKSLYRKYNRTLTRELSAGQKDPDVFSVDDLKSFFTKIAILQEAAQTANIKVGKPEMEGLGGLDPDWWRSRLNDKLLGDHSDEQQDDFSGEDLEEEHKEVFGDLLQDLTRDLSANPNAKGLFTKGWQIDEEAAPDELSEALARGMREDIMKCKDIVETVIGVRPSHLTVVPKHFGRKEIAMLAAGIVPIFWPAYGPDEKPNGDVSIYIDVSGSMGDQAQFILMLMTSFKEQIQTEFYQFSTVVAPTPYYEFLKHFEETGEVFQTTTGGTDFSPIFKHADEMKFSKIVLITDGEAGVSPEAEMLARSMEVYTVFTQNHSAEPLSDLSAHTWVMPRIKQVNRNKVGA